MSPHFLNNILNIINWTAIEETGNEDSLTSQQLILLSDIIRTMKEQTGNLTTVTAEIEYTKKFMELECLRFGPYIHCSYDIAGSILQAPIPAISLQTLVENAITHGLQPKNAVGSINLKIAPNEMGGLFISVEDDGVGMEQDKINAYMTLYTALVTICKAAAPMIPFMTEDIYQNLVRSNDANAPESIHLCDFPVVNKDHIDKKLEEDMEDVLDAVVMGRACRNEAAIKNRQPISRMYIKSDFTLSEFYQEIIEDELNVKEVVFTDDVRDFTSYTFKPQLRTVGPKYGKQLGGIQKHLAALDGNAAMDELNADGALKFDVDGVAVELTKDDLLIDMAQKEGYVSQEDNRMTVVLDTNLTPELVEEGFVYEIISKIQTMRKESGFEVTDHIRVSINGNDKLSEIAQKNKEAISGKVLADELTSGAEYGVSKEWNINGENAVIAVERV